MFWVRAWRRRQASRSCADPSDETMRGSRPMQASAWTPARLSVVAMSASAAWVSRVTGVEVEELGCGDGLGRLETQDEGAGHAAAEEEEDAEDGEGDACGAVREKRAAHGCTGQMVSVTSADWKARRSRSQEHSIVWNARRQSSASKRVLTNVTRSRLGEEVYLLSSSD